MEAVAGQPGIFSKTITEVCNGTVYYYFINGSFTDEAGATKNQEKFNDTTDRACTKPNGVGGFQRELIRTTGDEQTLDSNKNIRFPINTICYSESQEEINSK
jgi:hypothetical protein